MASMDVNTRVVTRKWEHVYEDCRALDAFPLVEPRFRYMTSFLVNCISHQRPEEHMLAFLLAPLRAHCTTDKDPIESRIALFLVSTLSHGVSKPRDYNDILTNNLESLKNEVEEDTADVLDEYLIRLRGFLHENQSLWWSGKQPIVSRRISVLACGSKRPTSLSDIATKFKALERSGVPREHIKVFFPAEYNNMLLDKSIVDTLRNCHLSPQFNPDFEGRSSNQLAFLRMIEALALLPCDKLELHLWGDSARKDDGYRERVHCFSSDGGFLWQQQLCWLLSRVVTSEVVFSVNSNRKQAATLLEPLIQILPKAFMLTSRGPPAPGFTSIPVSEHLVTSPSSMLSTASLTSSQFVATPSFSSPLTVIADVSVPHGKPGSQDDSAQSLTSSTSPAAVSASVGTSGNVPATPSSPLFPADDEPVLLRELLQSLQSQVADAPAGPAYLSSSAYGYFSSVTFVPLGLMTPFSCGEFAANCAALSTLPKFTAKLKHVSAREEKIAAESQKAAPVARRQRLDVPAWLWGRVVPTTMEECFLLAPPKFTLSSAIPQLEEELVALLSEQDDLSMANDEDASLGRYLELYRSTQQTEALTQVKRHLMERMTFRTWWFYFAQQCLVRSFHSVDETLLEVLFTRPQAVLGESISWTFIRKHFDEVVQAFSHSERMHRFCRSQLTRVSYSPFFYILVLLRQIGVTDAIMLTVLKTLPKDIPGEIVSVLRRLLP